MSGGGKNIRILVRKITLAAGIVGLVLTAILGCKLDFANPANLMDEDNERGFNTKSITAFSLPSLEVAGTIDQKLETIAVMVPYGTDIKALVATFTTTGSSVKVGSKVQVSGTTANNFTKTVTYTVTAVNGTTAKYKVTVTPSSNKAITAFSFASVGAAGTVDEGAKTIAVTVPAGTNVSALVATFTTTGASVSVVGVAQVSGTTANNYANPVTYTVTAEDGSAATYTVTVKVTAQPPSSAKAITAFSFPSVGAIGTIDQNAKTVAVILVVESLEGSLLPFGKSWMKMIQNSRGNAVRMAYVVVGALYYVLPLIVAIAIYLLAVFA